MMVSLRLVLLLTGWFVVGLAADARAQASPSNAADPQHFGGVGITNVGNRVYIHQDGAFVLEKDRLRVCYGVLKQQRKAEQYLYMVLIKNDPGPGKDYSADSSSTGNDNTFVSVSRMKRSGKLIEITHTMNVDQTGALQGMTLKLGDTEIKPDSPRVFLLDMKADKLEYRPVKVGLPKAVPALGKGELDRSGKLSRAWAKTVMQGVKQLEEQSDEVRDFLKD